jgi:hypothetical protein
LAIDLAKPNYFLTITKMSDPWPDNRDVMTAMKIAMRELWASLRWCWAIEQVPGSEPHAHAFVRTQERLDPAVLNALGARMGTGHIDVQCGPHHGAYILKAAMTRTYSSGESALLGLNAHLDLNGSRLVHNHRDFFLDTAGRVVTKAKAEAIVARQQWRG